MRVLLWSLLRCLHVLPSSNASRTKPAVVVYAGHFTERKGSQAAFALLHFLPVLVVFGFGVPRGSILFTNALIANLDADFNESLDDFLNAYELDQRMSDFLLFVAVLACPWRIANLGRKATQLVVC